MPKYKEWAERLDVDEFIEHECNCQACVDDRGHVAHKAIFNDALQDLFPYWVDALPRRYDKKYAFLNRNTDLRYVRADSGEYYRILLSVLHQTSVHNDRLKPAMQGELAYCVDCGLIHPLDKEIPVKGVNRPVCPACWDQYYMKCHVCGEVKDKHGRIVFQPRFDYDKWAAGRGNRSMCRECYTDFMKCQVCSMPVDEAHWHNVSLQSGYAEETEKWTEIKLDGKIYNENDFWDDDIPEEAEILRFERPFAVCCDHCIEDAFRPCEKCNTDVARWKTKLITWRGRKMRVCQTCYENRRVIKAYDFAVRPAFRYAGVEPTLSHMLHYGIEIEMEYRGRIVGGTNQNPIRKQDRHLENLGQEIMDWWPDDFCYIKHDGTLEYGYEAVTHPFTWDHFLENSDKWSEFLLWLRELGFKAYYYSRPKEKYTCAMHVHMSKDAFTRMHLYKFIHFMYKKSTRPFINAIAERAGSQYADFQVADSKYAVQVGKNKKNASGRRHSAVNLLGGHAHEHNKAPKECSTCEVRIFQGYLEPVKFFKNMEFLQSLYEFTSFNSPRDMQVNKYVEYLLLKPNRFPALLDFIKYNDEMNRSYAYLNKMLKGV